MGSNMTGMVYWTELAESEDGWLHALPFGTYKHNRYGEISLTRERVRRFAANVNQGVRGIELDVNYDHAHTRNGGGPAAGWIKAAEVRPNGLWLLVDWTEDAASDIKDGRYKYFSAEFVDEWQHPETEEVYEDVLFGGSLTNRPFMKDLVPVNLSERTFMDRDELINLLGLSEEASEEDIREALSASGGHGDVDLGDAEIAVGEDGSVVITHPDLEGSLEIEPQGDESEEEEDEVLASLAEEHPEVKALMEQTNELGERVNTLEHQNRQEEVTRQLSEINDSGSDAGYSLPPAAEQKFRDVMVQLPKKLSDEVYAALVELGKVGGFVELGERAGGKVTNPNKKGDAVKEFNELVDEKQKELAETSDGPVTRSDAMKEAIKEDRELYRQYTESVAESQQTVTT